MSIHVRGLRRSYGEQVVLDGLDLDVARGTVYALLGPNGAGKTTTVQILSTLLPADGGEVVVAGHDLRADPSGVRGAIGVTGQFSAVDALLTGRENLVLMADLHHLGRAAGRRRAHELLERFDLVDAADRSPGTWSGGMRRRLDLAMTLVGSPQVIFLDEPTAGLDPRSRRTMWDTVRDLVTGWGHGAADHPVPGGGRRARRPDRCPGRRAAGRRGHRGGAQAARPGRARAAALRRRRGAGAGRARRRRGPRRRRAHPGRARRRRRPLAARPARPARPRRGGRPDRAHPRPRRRLPRPHR